MGVGDKLAVVANPNYWDTANKPKSSEIDFEGVPSDSAFTTGSRVGRDQRRLSALDLDARPAQGQLQRATSISARRMSRDAIIVSNSKGPLADPKVRTALSMAIDRQGLIDANYKGAALLPRAVANPGTWGYAKPVFQKGWDRCPRPSSTSPPPRR